MCGGSMGDSSFDKHEYDITPDGDLNLYCPHCGKHIERVEQDDLEIAEDDLPDLH